MALNVDKNKDAVVGAWREVMDEKIPTDWALFGYDGLSYDLNLVSKGDGGIEELIDEFNSGKIMYALCRVKVKEKNVEKVVLINWQGEGAPLARKGTCANHVSQVKSFFKGIHVTMNARTDEDVEPDIVLQFVAKATAGDGVMHTMSNEIETTGAVGTAYKRTNPMEDINSAAKDEFWRKEEQEEERRKRDEQNKLRKFSQNEVKLLRRESEEYFNEVSKVPSPSGAKVNGSSPAATAAASNNITTTTATTNGSNSNNNANGAHFTSAAAVKASTPRKSSTGSAGDLVRARIKSFDQGTSSPQSSPNAANSNGVSSSNGNGKAESLSVLKRRQMFEGGSVPSSNPPPARANPAQEIKLAQEKAQIEQEKLAKANASSSAPVNNIIGSSSSSPKQPAAAVPAAVNVLNNSPPVKSNNNDYQHAPPAPAKAPYSPTPPAKAAVPDVVPVVTAAALEKPISPVPPPMAFANNTESPVLKSDKNTNGFIHSASPLSHHHDEFDEPSSIIHTGAVAVENGTTNNSNQPPAVPPPDYNREETSATPTLEILPDMGVCARALYDYQAADDSEITFDPGEIITNIEQIDEGWWEGMGPHGVYGLFPANYVELLN